MSSCQSTFAYLIQDEILKICSHCGNMNELLLLSNISIQAYTYFYDKQKGTDDGRFFIVIIYYAQAANLL